MHRYLSIPARPSQKKPPSPTNHPPANHRPRKKKPNPPPHQTGHPFPRRRTDPPSTQHKSPSDPHPLFSISRVHTINVLSWLRLGGLLRVIPFFLLWIVFRSRPRRVTSARLPYQLLSVKRWIGVVGWCGTLFLFLFCVFMFLVSSRRLSGWCGL